jgi:hypothetical protein
MTTIIIDDKSTSARKMIEFLKTQRYAKIIEEREPSVSLKKSMEEARTGKVIRAKNVEELITKLNK